MKSVEQSACALGALVFSSKWEESVLNLDIMCGEKLPLLAEVEKGEV
jgi:hypothetical protein